MPNPPTLKADDVITLVGDLNASTVAAIIATGATAADLEIAYACVMGNDRQEGELGPLAGNAALIYDILQADPAYAPPADH